MEVGLHDRAAFQRDLFPQRGAQSHDDAAFHLLQCRVGMNEPAAIDCRDDTVDARQAIGAERRLDHFRDPRAVALVDSDAATDAGRQRLAPAGALRGRLEHVAFSRSFGQQIAAVFERVAACCMGQLVDEALGPERMLGVGDRAPRAGMDMGGKVDRPQRLVGNAIGQVERLVARRPRKEPLRPGDRHPFIADSSLDARCQRRAIGAVRELFLAAEDQLHRSRRHRQRNRHQMTEIVGGRRDAASERTAGGKPVHNDIVCRQTRKLDQQRLGAERILLAGPKRENAVGEARRRIDRLHRAMMEIGNPILRLQNALARRRGKRGIGIARAMERRTRCGERRVLRLRQPVVRETAIASVGECRVEGKHCLVRLPPALPDHGDGAVEPEHIFDARHGPGGLDVDAHQAAAMNRRRAHRRVQHIGQGEVDAVGEAAVGLGGNVEPHRGRTDETPFFRLLQPWIARNGKVGGVRRQFAEPRRSVALRIVHHAIAHGELRRRHIPAPRRGLHQHGASCRACEAHPGTAGEPHGRRAAGDLQVDEARGLGEHHVGQAVGESGNRPVLHDPATCQKAVGERFLARRTLRAHLRPVGVHFVRRHHRQRRMDALAHVYMRDLHRDDIVGADLDPPSQKMLARPFHVAARGTLETPGPGPVSDHQTAGRRGGTQKKATPPHAPASICRTTAWIAARMRG